jgi:hypothetical protein
VVAYLYSSILRVIASNHQLLPHYQVKKAAKRSGFRVEPQFDTKSTLFLRSKRFQSHEAQISVKVFSGPDGSHDDFL